MGDQKINLTSTAVEKAIDLAKDFLDKLILPAVEEIGLLLRDKVTFWRTKNQVQILNKAKMYCEKHNVSLKTISLKVLCPLLDYAGLEEDEIMQDKWALLLANMVDSALNIENHVFPYILSQISKDEFLFLQGIYESRLRRKKTLSIQLETLREENTIKKRDISNKANELNAKMALESDSHKQWHLKSQIIELEQEQRLLGTNENKLLRKMSEPENVPEDHIQPFELANLVRLGLAKEIYEPYADTQTLEIPNDPHGSYLRVDLDIDVESNNSHILTELGELFMSACTERDITM